MADVELMDKLFGDLRAVVHSFDGSAEHYTALWKTVQDALDHDAERYEREWVPYLKEADVYAHPWSIFDSVETWRSAQQAVPFARFSLSHEALDDWMVKNAPQLHRIMSHAYIEILSAIDFPWDEDDEDDEDDAHSFDAYMFGSTRWREPELTLHTLAMMYDSDLMTWRDPELHPHEEPRVVYFDSEGEVYAVAKSVKDWIKLMVYAPNPLDSSESDVEECMKDEWRRESLESYRTVVEAEFGQIPPQKTLVEGLDVVAKHFEAWCESMKDF